VGTGQNPGQPTSGQNLGRPASGWHGALPEVAVAAAMVAAAAAAGYAVAGPEALTIVMIVAAAGALVLVRGLLPAAQPPSDIRGGTDSVTAAVSFYRYWHYVADLREGTAARSAYEMKLRPALEHLLAARLAERHGVNLYRDPAAARRLLCRAGRDNDLWAWIDPDQASKEAAGKPPSGRTQPPGIPRRTLERLINRLEQL
jgi:hypothetical protein